MTGFFLLLLGTETCMNFFLECTEACNRKEHKKCKKKVLKSIRHAQNMKRDGITRQILKCGRSPLNTHLLYRISEKLSYYGIQKGTETLIINSTPAHQFPCLFSNQGIYKCKYKDFFHHYLIFKVKFMIRNLSWVHNETKVNFTWT